MHEDIVLNQLFIIDICQRCLCYAVHVCVFVEADPQLKYFS